MLGSKGNIDLFIGLGASTSLGTLYCGLNYDSSSKIIEENGLRWVSRIFILDVCLS